MSGLYPCAFNGKGFDLMGAGHVRRACAEFGEGEIVLMSAENERSARSHGHQFAQVTDYWRTLPERLADQPYAKSPDTLRKHALIATGHANCEVIACGSKAAAERVGAYVGHLATKAHGYAITDVREATVRVWTPHSQSKAAMGAEEFQASKTAVLGWIEALLAEAAA